MGESQRVMGLDYGEARIGVALSDPLALFATPYCIIRHTTSAADFAALKAIAEEQQVVKVVIGLPTDAHSEIGKQAATVIRWARRLARHLHLPIVFWDESYSSLAAEQIAQHRKGRRPKPLDDVAAAAMLQEYLDARETEDEPGQPLEAYADIP